MAVMQRPTALSPLAPLRWGEHLAVVGASPRRAYKYQVVPGGGVGEVEGRKATFVVGSGGG